MKALCTASPAAGPTVSVLCQGPAAGEMLSVAGKGMEELPCGFIFNTKRFSYRHSTFYLLDCVSMQPRMTRINPLGKDKGCGEWEPKGLNSDKVIEQLEAVSATVSWEAWLYRETAVVHSDTDCVEIHSTKLKMSSKYI